MEENTKHGLREQRLHRRRVNRMKTAIMAGAGIWAVLSVALVVTLLVKVVLLENKVEQLTESVIKAEQVAQGNRERNASPDSARAENGEGGIAPDGGTAQTGTPLDNSRKEGQTQKVYLTFDDGPSENTARLLDILKEKNVKATFFVIGKEDEQSRAMYQRIVAEGHTLGMHSFTHKYNIIYESLESFAEDVNHLQSYLAEITGAEPTIMRFPGGSSNKVSSTDMTEFIRYLNENEIAYYDWNVASGDATSQAYTAEDLIQNVVTDVNKYDTSIVLMHDATAKSTTVDALGPMIDQLQAMGAALLPIDENTKLIQHIPADSIE